MTAALLALTVGTVIGRVAAGLRWPAHYDLHAAIGWAAWAAYAAYQRLEVPAVLECGFAAYYLWRWWRRRPPRKRRASRALSAVRDLGHRLTVAPAPAAAGAR